MAGQEKNKQPSTKTKLRHEIQLLYFLPGCRLRRALLGALALLVVGAPALLLAQYSETNMLGDSISPRLRRELAASSREHIPSATNPQHL